MRLALWTTFYTMQPSDGVKASFSHGKNPNMKLIIKEGQNDNF